MSIKQSLEFIWCKGDSYFFKQRLIGNSKLNWKLSNFLLTILLPVVFYFKVHAGNFVRSALSCMLQINRSKVSILLALWLEFYFRYIRLVTNRVVADGFSSEPEIQFVCCAGTVCQLCAMTTRPTQFRRDMVWKPAQSFIHAFRLPSTTACFGH